MVLYVNKTASSLTSILAFAIVINAPALALQNDIDSSKTTFRKKTSSKLSICSGVHNEEENTYV